MTQLWSPFLTFNLMMPLLFLLTYGLMRLAKAGQSAKLGRQMAHLLWIGALAAAFLGQALVERTDLNTWAPTPWQTASQGVQTLMAPLQTQAIPATTLLRDASIAVSGWQVAIGLWCLLSAMAMLRLFKQYRQVGGLFDGGYTHKALGKVRIVYLDTIEIPLAFWRPGHFYIGLPTHLLHGDSAIHRAALNHEIQHHRQGDTQLTYFWAIMRALLLPNPFTHKALDYLLELYELACDEVVTRRKISPRAYAHCLLEMAARRNQERPYAFSLPFTHNLRWRIEAMIHREEKSRTGLGTYGLFATGLCLMGLTSTLTAESAPTALSYAQVEALAASSQDDDFTILVDQAVVDKVNLFLVHSEAHAFMAGGLVGLENHQATLAPQLAAAGLPDELLAVPLIESGYQNMPVTSTGDSAAPGPRGAGLWMFIESTAKLYGLVVNDKVDERLDIDKETQAAIRLLSDLHDGQSTDWGLALAAYNQGPAKVRAALAQGEDKNALELAEAGHLNNYVATVMAGVILMKNPDLMQ